MVRLGGKGQLEVCLPAGPQQAGVSSLILLLPSNGPRKICLKCLLGCKKGHLTRVASPSTLGKFDEDV